MTDTVVYVSNSTGPLRGSVHTMLSDGVTFCPFEGPLETALLRALELSEASGDAGYYHIKEFDELAGPVTAREFADASLEIDRQTALLLLRAGIARAQTLVAQLGHLAEALQSSLPRSAASPSLT